MVTITLKGRKIPLLFTTAELLEIQEEIAPIGKALVMIAGNNPEDESDMDFARTPERLKALATAIRILGNAGLEENGEAPDLKEKWILRAVKPFEVLDAASACMDALAEGMASEIPKQEEEGPVDVTLEEMKKKDGPES